MTHTLDSEIKCAFLERQKVGVLAHITGALGEDPERYLSRSLALPPDRAS